MNNLPERVEVLEDEVKGLDSMIDSRTRRLWAEIQTLQAEIAILKSAAAGGQKDEA